MRIWAQQNPTEFYKHATSLMPKEINLGGEQKVKVILTSLRGGEEAGEGEK